ncbi:MAG: hypothetical protein GWO87_01290 [Xanthomonadaceae bacterium]|nr:hypothetical protein [Rhodospirillaceae bacterium]NIA17810.1 hypothetical protein [Xanthomonadaceae bacterium]
MSDNLIYKDLFYKIVGIFFEIHNELGRYKNEKQYADRFEQKLKENSINYLGAGDESAFVTTPVSHPATG